MQTVNFFLPVNIPTGHPTFENPSLWIGRAIITQETDYDDNDQPFTVDMAEITDLFFLPYAGDDIKTARRVELPHPSLEGKSGFTFRYKLQQAAILAYHNPQLQPREMPDDELQSAPKIGDIIAFPVVTLEEIKEARIPDRYINKVASLVGKQVEIFFVDTNEYDEPFSKGYFELNETAMFHGILFPLQWLRK